jgi:pilus assembly protein Flp/PilA
MLEFIRNITSRRDEDGASAVEYGLLVAGIAALIVAIVFLFGGVIKDAFQSTCNRVKQGSSSSATTC